MVEVFEKKEFSFNFRKIYTKPRFVLAKMWAYFALKTGCLKANVRTNLGTTNLHVLILPWNNGKSRVLNKINDLILNVTPENITQHSGIE